jgi:GT2 family glycosyltransferase
MPSRVIIIDNGGDVDRKLPMDCYTEFIRPNRNLGVAASWNMLHKLAAPLPLIILNDDVEVAPSTFALMLASGQPLVCAAGWFAFLQDESVWKTVGDYDESFWPAYHEDGDYRYRCLLKGITPFDMDAGVKHEPSQTKKRFTEQEEAEFMQRWQACHELFQAKWGGLPGRETFSIPYDGKHVPK